MPGPSAVTVPVESACRYSTASSWWSVWSSPAIVCSRLANSCRSVKGKKGSVDLGKTYTTEFVTKVQP